MAYRFKLDESFGEGLVRIGAEQLKRARAGLEAAPAPSAIHDTRKSIKRLRALLRLVRPGIGDVAFKRENERLRDLSRLLSGARDQAVLRQTIERLARAQGGDAAVFDKLQVAHAAAPGNAGKSEQEGFEQASQMLEQAWQSWPELRLEPDSFAPIGEGLGHVHQRCKDGLEAAFAERERESERDEAFHDWRKVVQQHWRHMRLLELGWPQHFAARYTEAKALSELLGVAQDLSVFVAFVEQVVEQRAGVTRKQGQRLVALARAEQEALRSAARPRGQRLFAEGTAGHVRRTLCYWSTAAEIEPARSNHAGEAPVEAAVMVELAETAEPAGRRIAAARSRTSRARTAKSSPD